MALEELKTQIKSTPISQILGFYISVEKKGAQFAAVCPFHDDHDPSLQINDSRNMYMCFVDDMGGDAIHFVMNFLNCSFVEALRDICEKLGLNWEDYQEKQKIDPDKKLAQKLTKNAALIYQKVATSSHQKEFNYFLKKRGLTLENATLYQLGFSPKHNVFTHYLESIKSPDEKKKAFNAAMKVGLLKQNDSGQYYDTFRERIMFPIWDQYGHVTAFTSRATQDYQKAKYMNSKDSMLFNKRNILYGLHLAKEMIRKKDRVILVEGNMDQLSLYVHGFQESVAIMGVALSSNNAVILKNFTNKIYLCLDNDQAGFKAAQRINELFLEKGTLPYFVDLSPHKDPDDFVNNLGKIAFEQRLEEAALFVDLLIKTQTPDNIPEVVDRKIELLQDLYQIISPLKLDLRATERVVKYAEQLGLETSKDQILENYRKFLSGTKHPKATQSKIEGPPQDFPHYELEETPYIQEVSPQVSFEPRPSEPPSSVELRFIEACVVSPAIFEGEQINEILEMISHYEVKELVSELKEHFYELDELSYRNFVNTILRAGRYHQRVQESLSAGLFKKESTNNSQSVPSSANEVSIQVSSFLADLKEDSLRSRKKQLREEHKMAKEETQAKKLLEEIFSIDQKLQDLKTNKTLNTNS